jgi:uroporphyrinogen III methyltransferase/synthase
MSGQDAAERTSGAGVVFLLGGGPGDPGLITVRAAEVLASVDVVLHDELVHPALLELCRADAEVRCVGKRGGNPAAKQAKQADIDAELVALATAGRSVARLKGGDPFLFGRGSEEAEVLARHGIPFEIVPGVCSPLGASAYAGISLTHRDLASSVTFVSGTTRAGAGFDWTELAGIKGTVCVLMGMRRIDEITRGLIDHARRDPATPCAVIQWGTRADQAVVTGRLDAIAALAREAGLGSPSVILVGPVVALRSSLRWFDNRPLFGKRVLVTRPKGQAGATARLLRGRGADPIVWPTITLGPPPDPARVDQAVRELDGYDVVAFTSENGVDWFWSAIERAGRDARVFGRARVAAIGTGTAEALARRGVRADIMPTEFRGEELAAAILADRGAIGRSAPWRALVPRALVAREVLPELLREAGVEVDVVPVYETRSVPADRRDELQAMLEAGKVDVVLLTASSTADAICELLAPRAVELLAGVLIASIGPITTRTAEKRGLTVGVTAEVSTTAGLIAAVERRLAG